MQVRVDQVELLRALIRFDTSNPPGNERACIEYIGGVLDRAGVEHRSLALDAERPNLVARVPGQGVAPPLLLYGHVDVVPADPAEWSRPPFAGELVGGEVWGRGALDMKSGVATIIAVLLRLRAEGIEPAGDLIVALTCDEERGSEYGAKFLVEQHADLFEGVRYALSEAGGFTVWHGSRRLYPIQVAEKQALRLRAVVRGAGGHASLATRDTAMQRVAWVVESLAIDKRPIRVTPLVARTLREIAHGLGAADRIALRLLLVPGLTRPLLSLAGRRADRLRPLLHDTVTPTVIRGGELTNVIPTEIELELDARLLPGRSSDALLHELQTQLGDAVELSLLREEPAVPSDPDLALFPMLTEILRQRDPGCHPFPLVSPGYTDARHFSRLGIQTYGFLPLRLPQVFPENLLHAPDERVPAEALEFGVDCLIDVIRRYR